jgi:hypothetical protein
MDMLLLIGSIGRASLNTVIGLYSMLHKFEFLTNSATVCKRVLTCEISGSRGDEYENVSLLGYSAV